MSERGTWVTEFIYCDACVEAFGRFLAETQCEEATDENRAWSFWRVGDHAFAGRIGGLFSCEELQLFESDLVPRLKELLCHPLRIAVLADGGAEIFNVLPPVRPIQPMPVHARPLTQEQRAANARKARRLAAAIDKTERP